MAVIALVLALVTIIGIYASSEAVFEGGGNEVEDTAGFFSGCMGGILSDSSSTNCDLFSENSEGEGNG